MKEGNCEVRGSLRPPFLHTPYLQALLPRILGSSVSQNRLCFYPLPELTLTLDQSRT